MSAAYQPPPLQHLVRLQLVGKEELAASTVGRNDKFIQLVKALPFKGTWNAEAREWRVHWQHHGALKDALLQQGFYIEDVSSAALDLVMKGYSLQGYPVRCPKPKSPQEVQAEIATLPPGAQEKMTKLYPFQRQGVEFVVSRHGRAMLADEMGLGKTVQALVAACVYRKDWPLLIVVPASMRFSWKESVHEWVSHDVLPNRENVFVIKTGKDYAKLLERYGNPLPAPHVIIVSYTLASKIGDENLRQYKTIICDESHALKDKKTLRTKFMLQWGNPNTGARRVILVSGTPILSRPLDLYSQLEILRPGLLGSYYQYGLRYCTSDYFREQEFRSGAPNRPTMHQYAGEAFRQQGCLLELNAAIMSSVVIRREKKDVAIDLPDKIRQRVPVEPQGVANLKRLRKEFEAALQVFKGCPEDRDALLEVKKACTKLYTATGPAKVPATWEFLEELFEAVPDLSVLVFAHHKAVLDALQELLQKKERSYVRIDGSVPAVKRDLAVTSFQNKQAQVALLSIKAAGAGLTLNTAQAVVFAEMTWNPSEMLQAEDRAHRIGVKYPVNVYYLHAPDSIDDHLWSKSNDKLKAIERAVGGKAGGGSLEAGTGNAEVLPTPARGTPLKETVQNTLLAQLGRVMQDNTGGFEDPYGEGHQAPPDAPGAGPAAELALNGADEVTMEGGLVCYTVRAPRTPAAAAAAAAPQAGASGSVPVKVKQEPGRSDSSSSEDVGQVARRNRGGQAGVKRRLKMEEDSGDEGEVQQQQQKKKSSLAGASGGTSKKIKMGR